MEVAGISYPILVDEELLSWILIMNDLYLLVSVLAAQKKAKSLILLRNSSFEASKSWICQYSKKEMFYHIFV